MLKFILLNSNKIEKQNVLFILQWIRCLRRAVWNGTIKFDIIASGTFAGIIYSSIRNRNRVTIVHRMGDTVSRS